MLKYFDGKLTQGFTALYSGRTIQFVADGLIGLFLPIYLLVQLGLGIEKVFLYYLVGHFVYVILLPLGAQVLNKIGLRQSLRLSIIFYALYLTCVWAMKFDLGLYLPLSMFAITIFRLLFWLPFQTDLAKFTDKLNRGKELGLIEATYSFLSIFLPAISGVIVGLLGFDLLFLVAIIIHLLSILPFLLLPHTDERFSWTYGETIRQFFSAKNRKLVLANMANGAENAVAIVIWPIFIWQIFEGNYLAVGGVSSVIVLAAVLIELWVGKYADSLNRKKMMRWGSIFYSLGWIVKIFAFTAFHVFAVGVYHKITQIFKNIPFATINYELMADSGHYVDEYTVIKEMAVQLGKTLILVFAIFIAGNIGLNWTFGLAALASLVVNLL